MAEQRVGDARDSRSSDFDRIEPTPVTPIGQEPPPLTRSRRRKLWWVWAGITAVALLSLAATLFWLGPQRLVLPHLPATAPVVTEPSSSSPVVQEPAAPAPPTAEAPIPQLAAPDAQADVEEILAQRQQAEELAETLIRKREQLGAHGVERWAAERYADTTRLAEQGARRFEAHDYSGAADAYRKAGGMVDDLLEQAPTVLADALRRGDRALAENDGEAAHRAFSLALAVDPDNADAQKGMQRAQNLDEVLALLESGRAHEQAGELSAARDEYRQALALDDGAEAAREGLARVEAALAAGRFQQHMSAGLAAIERRDYSAAREAFEAAGAIRPNAPEVADGLTQAEQGLQMEAIAEHRARAEAFEKDERWRAALDEYESVLAIDRTLAFAQAGRERAAALAELTEQLQFHIDHSQRLNTAKVRENAKALLAEAEAVVDPGPELRRQRDKLTALLARAQTPVPVQLRSDNKTRVLIYHVGELGAFESKQIELLPGQYTAIGRCEGYRDVRHVFSVAAGEPAGPIDIRCEEKI